MLFKYSQSHLFLLPSFNLPNIIVQLHLRLELLLLHPLRVELVFNFRPVEDSYLNPRDMGAPSTPLTPSLSAIISICQIPTTNPLPAPYYWCHMLLSNFILLLITLF